MEHGDISQHKKIMEMELPYVEKDKVLFDVGVAHGVPFSSEKVKMIFSSTDWKDKERSSLFNDHEHLKAAEWLGYVANPRLEGNKVMGDLYVYDMNMAMKLALAKPKFGVSPRIAIQQDRYGNVIAGRFENFSIVIGPEVKTAYINNQADGKEVRIVEEKNFSEADAQKVAEKVIEIAEQKRQKEFESQFLNEIKFNDLRKSNPNATPKELTEKAYAASEQFRILEEAKKKLAEDKSQLEARYSELEKKSNAVPPSEGKKDTQKPATAPQTGKPDENMTVDEAMAGYIKTAFAGNVVDIK